jgi:hypothetical protein
MAEPVFPEAPENVFTGFEGIITPDLIDQERALRLQKEAQLRRTKLSGAEFGASQAGALTGQLITSAIRRLAPNTFDEPRVKAQKAQEAIQVARRQVKPSEFNKTADGEVNPFADVDRRIAMVGAAIGEMKSRGLHQEADQLRANLLQLKQTRLERQKLNVETEREQVGLDTDKVELALKEGEAAGRDETTRLLNRLETLDPEDPADARQLDFVLKRLNKLTEVTGRTEFDVDDKSLFRNSLGNLSNAQQALSRIDGVIDAFDPRFLTAQGKVKNFALSVADTLDLDIPAEAKKAFADYKLWQTRTVTNLNLYIKEITGAQMSAQEAKRLMKGLPNEEDSPTAFAAKARETQAVLQASLERAEAIALADAEGTPQDRIRARKIDVFRRAEELLDQREEDLLPSPVEPTADDVPEPLDFGGDQGGQNQVIDFNDLPD